jgi:purine nucleosidase/pyrimidine-specific ribonucleoside hydrolase
MPGKRRRLLIDTDPGVDDALAILLGFRSPEIEIVGITTVSGNVTLDQATHNLFRILGLLNPRPSVPVGCGAASPLALPLMTAANVHGLDGLGGLDQLTDRRGVPRYPKVAVPKVLPTAIDLWEEMTKQFPKQLILVTLGPLTNLAQALERKPRMVRRFREIICMGGAVGVPGNVTPTAEFNFYADPHAAQRVFEAGLPLRLIPLDVTTRVVLTGAQLRRLARSGRDPLSRFMGDATRSVLDFTERVEGRAVFHFHDPLAVGAAIDPSLVHCVPVAAAVETTGRLTRGMIVVDRRERARVSRPEPNVRVAVRVRARQFLHMFASRVCRGSLS